MKLIELSLLNFGPFRNEVIDFTSVDNLFLLTGDTGSGKTFIFDAITYALYGSVKGMRGEIRVGNKDELLASNFMDKGNEDSKIEFVFGVGKTFYRVTRYPIRNSKPKTRKALLEKSVDDGKNYEVVEDQVSKINFRITDILNLSLDEFSQIVLLPQGKFEEFMNSSSDKKREILKKIFPVEKFSRIVKEIDDSRKEYEKSIKEQQIIVSTNSIDGKSSSEMESVRDGLNNQKDELLKKISGSEETLKAYTTKITELKEKKAKSLQKENAMEKLREEESRKSYIDEVSGNLENAKRASDVGESYRNMIKVKGEFDSSVRNVQRMELLDNEKKNNLSVAEERRKELPELKKKIGKLPKEIIQMTEVLKKLVDRSEKYGRYISAGNVHKTISDSLDLRKKERDSLISSYSLETDIDEKIFSLREAVSDCARKLSDCHSVLDTAKKYEAAVKERTALEETVNKLKERDAELETDLSGKKSELERTEKEEELADLTARAAEIARQLKADMPCPVCGSTHHPNVAKFEESKNFAAIISALKSEIACTEKSKNANFTELTKVQANLDSRNEWISSVVDPVSVADAENMVSGIQTEFSEKKDELAQFAELKEKLQSADECIKKLEENLREAEFALNQSKVLYEEVTRSLEGETSSPDEVSNKIRNLKNELSDCESKEKDIEEHYSECKVESEKAKVNFENSVMLKEKLEEEKSSAEKNFAKKLSENNFVSEEDFLLAQKFVPKIYVMESEIKNHHETIIRLQSEINSIGEVEDLEKISVLSAELSEKQGQVERDIVSARNSLSELDQLLGKYNRALTIVHECEKEIEKTGKSYKLYDYLYQKFVRGTQLDTWALGAYYKKIVNFASQRFNQFSNGRYTLMQNTDYSLGRANSDNALDLYVYDSYTGETRDVKSLSGGERFEASLSLALAITDSVQYQLESIFIDEGFGTLDSGNREKVMPILRELKENKTVGIISHVESFKTEIPCQIQLTKTSAGSTIKIYNGTSKNCNF